jgi:hypothetical protein
VVLVLYFFPSSLILLFGAELNATVEYLDPDGRTRGIERWIEQSRCPACRRPSCRIGRVSRMPAPMNVKVLGRFRVIGLGSALVSVYSGASESGSSSGAASHLRRRARVACLKTRQFVVVR